MSDERRVSVLRTTIRTLRSDGGLDRLPPRVAALGGALVAGAIGGALLAAPGWLRFVGGAVMLGAGCAALARPRWVEREAHAAPTTPRDVLDMVEVPAGRFMMGSPAADDMAWRNETPQFEATVPSPLMVQRCPVTNGEYRRLVPEHAPGEPDELPVSDVDWFDAIRFCNAMSEAADRTPVYVIDEDAVRWQGGDGYRLLTEVEWEYACRAGRTTRYCFGDDPEGLDAYGWFDANSGGSKHPVGRKRANAFGLHDMHGNVLEWCWSPYTEYPLAAEPMRRLPARGQRVLRGGGFDDGAWVLRSADRVRFRPVYRFRFVGFRCVRGSRPEPTLAP